MPARKAATSKSKQQDIKATSKASKTKPVIITEKPSKEKPTVTTTQDSTPEEILHSSWTFLNLVQFYSLFRPYFHLPAVTIENLEHALLMGPEDSDDWSLPSTPTSSKDQDRYKRELSVISTASNQPDPKKEGKYLHEFLAHVLSPLLKSNRQRQFSLDQQIAILFPEYEGIPFRSLHIVSKIDLLKRVQDMHMESNDEKFIAYKNEKQAENLRVKPLGSDHDGWVYWYFGDTRLYREIPIPNGKRGNDMISSTDFTFQLICSNQQEWHEIIKTFQNSGKSRNLSMNICKVGLEVIATLEAREAARMRTEAKIKRAKELEMIPKKRSSRLEAKQEEDVKRQKVMEIARKQAELEEISRKKKAKQANKLVEQEKQEIRKEEARLKYDTQQYITKLLNESLASEVDTKIMKKQVSSVDTE